MLNEDASIEQIKKIVSSTQPPTGLVRGIGDDCAVIKPVPGQNMVLSVDSFVEGSHFNCQQLSYKEIGQLAALGAISDIAAMAAVPLYVLVSAKLPPSAPQEAINGIMSGINDVCRQTGAGIIGGNLAADTKISLDITVCGNAPEQNTALRTTAQPGDSVYVSGYLGTGALRLKWLQANRTPKLKKSEVFPSPRTRQALFLAENLKINAMMDISDGLVKDLSRLCKASGCGAILEANDIPINPAAKKLTATPTQLLNSALYGGEEYELCFTANKDAVEAITEEFNQTFGHTLYCVGKLTRQAGIFINQNGSKQKLSPDAGFDHFK